MSSATQPYPEQAAGLEVTELKEELRHAIRAERTRATARALERAALGFARVVGDLPQVRRADVVAAYVSRPTEPGTVPLLERLAARGTRVLLPVLGAGLQREWAWYAGTEDLLVRAPGRPPEPSGPSLPADAVGLAEVVVAPALAVDTVGRRLGQGGGWYDRVLAHRGPDVPVVALVYPDELYDAERRPLPEEEHDQRVDLVATPDGWRRLRSDAAGA